MKMPYDMETVHWFIRDPTCSISRRVRELRYFEKQLIPADESRTFTFEIDPLRDLGFVDRDGRHFVEPGQYRIIVGNKQVGLIIRLAPSL